ncbi:MAG: hypothetical protein SFU55_09005 [Methylophilus sp.]|nr:hypothetical protein [Methylophilus sp.]
MTTPLEDRIKASLNQSIDTLDAETRQRLQAIRRAALNQPSTAFKWRSWVPVASVAFCSVVAMLVILPDHQQATKAPLDQTAMLELLDNPEDLDTLSDPDFYMWVEELGVQNNQDTGEHHAV